jgi:Cdc6-like AAA superfamily ATPase
MTLQSTKTHLIQLLEDKENKVVALSGKWGTGKSHLWDEVKATSQDDAVKDSLYVSLFGLSDMTQIKLKIIQSALPNADAHPTAWENAKIGLKSVQKVLKSVHPGFSALDDLALLAVPTILKEKVIVLDDIERKHEKLSVDEVLGFIDEFTKLHKARFVLILNSDQLNDKTVWDRLREKVIDQEIKLNTSPSGACQKFCV